MVPILLSAQATPLATTNVTAIAINRRMSRRTLCSLPRGGTSYPPSHVTTAASFPTGNGASAQRHIFAHTTTRPLPRSYVTGFPTGSHSCEVFETSNLAQRPLKYRRYILLFIPVPGVLPLSTPIHRSPALVVATLREERLEDGPHKLDYSRLDSRNPGRVLNGGFAVKVGGVDL